MDTSSYYRLPSTKNTIHLTRSPTIADRPLNFHPEIIRASAAFTPHRSVGQPGDRRNWWEVVQPMVRCSEISGPSIALRACTGPDRRLRWAASFSSYARQAWSNAQFASSLLGGPLQAALEIDLQWNCP